MPEEVRADPYSIIRLVLLVLVILAAAYLIYEVLLVL
jgi:hypothetical protein